MFEWTITLFETNQLKEAQKKAFETFMSNTYLFDKFFNKEFLQFEKWEGSNWEMSETADRLPYTSTQEHLLNFSNWLDSFLHGRSFIDAANQFIEIQKELKILPVGKKRSNLIAKESRLLNLFD